MNTILDTSIFWGKFLYYFLESLVYRIIPKKKKNVAGEIVLITGAGSGLGEDIQRLREDIQRQRRAGKGGRKREGEGRDTYRIPKARGLRISLFLNGILVFLISCAIYFSLTSRHLFR